MIKLKNILAENMRRFRTKNLQEANETLLGTATDYKGFALSVVGTLMKYLNSWGGHAEVYKQVMKIDTKAKYDAVLALCKTSAALKSK